MSGKIKIFDELVRTKWVEEEGKHPKKRIAENESSRCHGHRATIKIDSVYMKSVPYDDRD